MVVTGVIAGLVVLLVAGLAIFDSVNDGLGIMVFCAVWFGLIVFFGLWEFLALLTGNQGPIGSFLPCFIH